MNNPSKAVQLLQTSTIPYLKDLATLPRYDRSLIRTGIVHFGPGAFHRAHQAAYAEDILTLDPRWGITGISLRSSGVRDALREQDYLYLLALLGRSTEYRVIGSLQEILVAPEDPQAVIARLVQPDVRVVSSTITEKGYCLTPTGELDTTRPEIQHDLQNLHAPRSALGFMCAALQQRREQGIAAFVPLSCDNMADNGRRVRTAMLSFAQEIDADFGKWMADEVSFPCTMVDSITPATVDSLREKVVRDLGIRDAWPIQREPFTQWVIEDAFGDDRPPWEDVGVTMTSDVRPFENAKLRLLNGAHSSLAYLGLLVGYDSVAEAMRDARLVDYLRSMMADEICPTLPAVDGLNLTEYCDSILERFENPNVHYQLAQIAWDGSQKIPFRLLMTIADNLRAGRSTTRLLLAVTAWMRLVRRSAALNAEHNDPLRDELFEIASRCNGDAKYDVEQLLSLRQMFTDELVANPGFFAGLVGAYKALGDAEAADVYRAIALA